MMLRTHSVMAFILALTAVGMFLHLFTVKQPVKGKRWLMMFYAGLFCWQVESVFRYSLPPQQVGLLAHKLSLAFFLVPALSLTLIAHTQYLYRFLAAPFDKESRRVLRVSIALFIIEFAFVIWNEFSPRGPVMESRLSAFMYSSVFTLWMIVVAIRKALHHRHNDPGIAQAHFVYAFINGCYVIGSTMTVAFGFLTVAGSWSYFMFVWLGNLASIVLYISTAAVPASFQTKITGFTFVLAASMLCIITLSFYPPDYDADPATQLVQHKGLARLMVITVMAALLIVTLMPMMLQISLTKPLQRLLDGVQRVNEGRLDTTVAVGLDDEIGVLTRNFNDMTQRLKAAHEELTEYAHNLEKKVAARTAQLQQSLHELKSTQAQLIQSEKMASLGELTAGIAHEIKNPLNFIVNFAESTSSMASELKEEMSRPALDTGYANTLIADIGTNADKIHHHGRRASNIVNSMLVHSRSSDGIRQATDVNELVDACLRSSYEEMQIKNNSFTAMLHKAYDPDAGKLHLVADDIGRVLINVFGNAFYALDERKKRENGSFEPLLSVSTLRKPGAVEVSIRDNGTGIPKKLLNKIYQPFFTTKPAGEGTGLGLSLSYDIVTKGHGGRMQVKSAEGEGTCFIISLPLPVQEDLYNKDYAQ